MFAKFKFLINLKWKVQVDFKIYLIVKAVFSRLQCSFKASLRLKSKGKCKLQWWFVFRSFFPARCSLMTLLALWMSSTLSFEPGFSLAHSTTLNSWCPSCQFLHFQARNPNHYTTAATNASYSKTRKTQIFNSGAHIPKRNMLNLTLSLE